MVVIQLDDKTFDMRFFTRTAVCFFFLSLLISACSTKKEVTLMKDPNNVHFIRTNNLGNVLDYAVKENKLVYVDIYTDWCLPCKIMNETVYSDKEAVDYLNDNFVCYKVNGEKVNGPDLVALFQVKNYPGILFLNQRGAVIEKNLGGLNKAQLMAMGDRVLIK